VKTRILILTVAAVTGLASFAGAQQRIGYVNSAKIFQELPAAQEAQKKIDAISKPMQDTLEAMQREFQASLEDYQKREAMLNDASKKEQQQKLMDLQQRFKEYQVEKFGQEGELARASERIVNPIREKIKKAISDVAREQKYNFVFDKTEQIQILLYGDPKDDLTLEVLLKLKKEKGK
jgi:outer membrane protein